MAESQTIKEFLVSLKFRADEASQKKVNTNIEDTGKKAKESASAFEKFGSALKIAFAVGAVVKFTDSLEQLYFQAKRTGAAEGSLRALSNAGKRFGATAEDINGSVLNLANSMRRMPGTENLLKGLGVNARDGTGKLRDRVEVIKDLGKQLAKMPDYQQAVYADQFGISDDTLRAITSKDFDKEFKEFKKIADKGNTEFAADQAHKIAGTAAKTAAEAQSAATKLGGEVIQTLSPALENLLGIFQKLDAATSGWASQLGVAYVAIRALGLGTAAKAIAGAGAALPAGVGAGAAAASGITARSFMARMLTRMAPFMRLGVGVELASHHTALNVGEKEELDKRNNMPATITPASKVLPAGRNNLPASSPAVAPAPKNSALPSSGGDLANKKPMKQNERIAKFVAENREEAERSGARLGVAPEIILGQWGLETGWGRSVIPGTNNLGNIKDFRKNSNGVVAKDNMNGSVDAYRKYATKREFTDDFGRLLEKPRYKNALNSGSDASKYFSGLKKGGYAEDPNYVRSGTTAANMAKAALQAQANMGAITRPMAPAGASQIQAQQPTRSAPSVNQTVTINVNGVSNPMETARQVERNQARVTNDMVRNIGQRQF